MPSSLKSPAAHRRSFLKTSGLLAGALVMPRLSETFNAPGLPALAALSGLGVLTPTSSAYPTAGQNFLTGIQNFYKQAGGPGPMLHSRSYASFGEALQFAQELIALGVPGVAALISPARASYLRDLFTAHNVPLYLATVGADQVRPGEEWLAATRTSLEHWQGALGLGAWAARSLGQRAFMAASVHDSGYDALYAFQLGYESAGGTVVETAISHRPGTSQDLTGLMAAIQRANPNLVYAAYCGAQAVEFVRAYMAAGLSKRIPLAGTSFMGDEALLSAYGLGAPTLYTGLTAFNLIKDQPAEPFTALGYHTGRRTAGAVDTLSTSQAGRSTYVRVSTPSPRAWRHQLLTLPLPDQALARANEVTDDIQTGWLSEYGCN